LASLSEVLVPVPEQDHERGHGERTIVAKLVCSDGQDLADHVETFRDIYNRIRPHEALGFRPPLTAYLNSQTMT
jgi:hypothetical protein